MRVAVVLFNLGGPDRMEAVEPFLMNLFRDPAIISAPRPVRWMIAKLVSARRGPVARGIYEKIGGRSPILENTERQARALEAVLSARGNVETRCFIAMRYWTPRAEEVVIAVKKYSPDRIILLPLYPQFSTTTTGSSFDEWRVCARAGGLDGHIGGVCCYATEPGLVAALADRIRAAVKDIADAAPGGAVRVLFSAHGLPEKVIQSGDPYQWHVERTARAVATTLGMNDRGWRVCYQSRVGPMKWIEPDTAAEIRRAGEEGVSLVVVPIAFVSEHSETLVELDMEYAKLARECGVPQYRRTPTVDDDPRFIEGLANMVVAALDGRQSPCAAEGGRVCPRRFARCPVNA